jgi:hypothetical protein
MNMNTKLNNQAFYLILMILIHQLILQSVAYFDMSQLFLIVRNTIVNTVLTFIILFAGIFLFKKKSS